jgi:2-haloalkanoic acid dehalogenase type II
LPSYEFITFDCYGTLIDWETGIAGAFRRAAAADGIDLQREEILHAYALVEPAVEREEYRRYRDVLAETAGHVAKMLGWRASNSGFLAESLPGWTPFPDTNPALQRLRAAGCRLGILSNIDDDLLAATIRHFPVDFELVVTAQQVRSYKPRAAHFLTAGERIGARWLHAAQSNFHDIVPTNQLGIANAWINRRGQKPLPGGIPTYEFANLTQLAEAMA